MSSDTVKPNSVIIKIAALAMTLPLMGFSMCSKKNGDESLKRAHLACVQSIRGFGPSEKTNLISTLDVTIQTVATQPKYSGLPAEWEQVKKKPFIADGVDQKIEKILSDANLSKEDGDRQIVEAIESTSFWKDTCSSELRNAIQKCADKFEYDSADWKSCLSSSPMASTDWVGEWSPFFGEYQKRIRPKLKEASAGAVGP